jgi:pantoate kinase
MKYDRSDELNSVFVHFGPISTREALSDPGLRRRINDLGGSYVDELKENLSPSRFMELSRRFTDYVGITTPRLKVVLDAADKAEVSCSMAMFGEALFSLVERDEAERVAEFYRETVPDQSVRVLPIDERGARLL